MQIQFTCPFWGQEQLSAECFVEKVVQAGYHGVEVNVPEQQGFDTALLNALQKNELAFIAQQWLPPARESVEKYIRRMEDNLYRLAEWSPVFINSHTGKDFFSFADNCRIIDACETVAEKTGIPIIHETHRGRFTFHAFHLLPYLEKYPRLQLTGDFSHFCTVSESLLYDQPDILKRIIPHVAYIHARIGSEQSPQVNDPGAPEWEKHLLQFFHWWDQVITHHKRKGTPVLYICPEFGPAPYMPAMPFTQKPLSDQWEVNCWMMNVLRERYLPLQEQPAVINLS
jgi:sugar phosphate isomerase/epimerase